MVANARVQVGDTTTVGDLTVGEFKTLVRTLMRQQLFEILEDFENYLPDPETGWTVKPEVWAKVRAFIEHERDKENG